MRLALWVLVAIVAACVTPAYCAPTTSPSGNPDRVEVQRQISDILSAPEYNRVYAKSDESSFAKKCLDKLGQWLRDFLAWMRNALSLKGDSAGRVASVVFACLVLLGFVLLMVLIIRKLAGSTRGWRDESLPYDFDESYELPTPEPLIRQAAVLAESGDYRGAFRCAYMASISRLNDAQALRFERGRTNWEYIRELKRTGFDESIEALRPVTQAFDRKFYGREACDRQDYLNAVAAYERIIGTREGTA